MTPDELKKQNAERLQDMRDADIEWVEWCCAQNGEDCPPCLALDGQRFPITTPPELPPRGCTCDPHCLSVLVAAG